MKKPSRRDFLRLLALASPGFYFSRYIPPAKIQESPTDSPNVILLIFDALSAKNMSLYGYPRQTTPNIDLFANKATVYHSHYAAGTFTTPGAGSLLTGLYPWTHRATTFRTTVLPKYSSNNIFNAIPQHYAKFAFTQNPLAEVLLNQFNDNINHHIKASSFALFSQSIGEKFTDLLAKDAFDEFLTSGDSASLLLGAEINFVASRAHKALQSEEFPYGVPRIYQQPIFYKIDDIFNGLVDQIKNLPQPFFAYIHVYPPHEPSSPNFEFSKLFNDDWKPIKKKNHTLGDRIPEDENAESRRRYDQFLAYADWGFGVFHEKLKSNNLLTNSHLMLGSDHGQMFERGVTGHISPLMYEPGIHIPLVISLAQQTTRKDIYTSTNNVDILPTLSSLLKSTVNWGEGSVLPGFSQTYKERSLYTFDAKQSPSPQKLSTVSMVLRKGDYKLIFYTGFKNYKSYKKDDRYKGNVFELYNIQEDPEELNDIFLVEKTVAEILSKELLEKYYELSKPING